MSRQAPRIEPNTLANAVMELRMVSISNSLPVGRSNFSISSFNGVPVFFAVFANSFKESICWSVYPMAFNSAFDRFSKSSFVPSSILFTTFCTVA